MKKVNRNIVLLVILILCVFENYITTIIPIFKYFDEFISVLALPIFLFTLIKNEWKVKVDKFVVKICFSLLFFIFWGTISFFTNSKQPLQALVGDVFLNLKFFLAIYVGWHIFGRNDQINEKVIGVVVKGIVYFLFLLMLINFIFPIFKGQEIRFGISIPRLFFTHSSYLSSAATLMLIITYRLYDEIKNVKFLVFCEVLIIFSTLRYKAIATAALCLFMLIIVRTENSKLKLRHIILGIAGVIFLAWEQISTYYGSSILSNARGALTVTSLKIAKDLLPLGAGFGTFASYMTVNYYSSYYTQYGISNIWGLSDVSGDNIFISDTFWPMVIGQTGLIGFLVYVYILYTLFKYIAQIHKYSKMKYLSCICVLIFLLIESTSSSAFVSPQAVPFGLWLGVMFFEFRSKEMPRRRKIQVGRELHRGKK